MKKEIYGVLSLVFCACAIASFVVFVMTNVYWILSIEWVLIVLQFIMIFKYFSLKRKENE